MTRFVDRRDAGRVLGAALRGRCAGRDDVLVLALPRGGVPVAYEVAATLGAPLGVLLVRRVRLPSDDELAVAAVASGGVTVVDAGRVARLGVAPATLDAAVAAERDELERMAQSIGADDDFDPRRRTVIIVDDGLCTGGTARAAAAAVRARGPAYVILAVPVAAAACCQVDGVDEIITMLRPDEFGAVSRWYDDFQQCTDAEVQHLLARARGGVAAESTGDEATHQGDAFADVDVDVPLEAGSLRATLSVPSGARGLILFAHGSGSSRQSARNLGVARALHGAGLGTLRVDLLTEAEQAADLATREHRFDVGLLADRLVATIDWIAASPTLGALRLGIFGASTGGAAALAAAALRRERVRAVVSRGGRSDLAEAALPYVTAPTLLLAGEWDEPVRAADERAREMLGGPSQTIVVPRATHLFGEPGALEEVGRLAREWFVQRLG